MTGKNSLRKASHAIPVAVLSLLLLSAGMCRQADDKPPRSAAEPSDTAEVLDPESTAPEPLDDGPTAAEIEEQERQAALAEAERELAEREARLAAEEERLRQERQLEAERAAAAERERQLAERERQLREQEAELARRQQELEATAAPVADEVVIVEQTAPEPLPEPTGTYEGNFDESWRESREAAATEPAGLPAETIEPGTGEPGPAPAATSQVSVEAGERLEVQIVETLSSETAREGDRISARLVGDLRNQDGKLVVPAGAEILGRVTEASPYRRGGGPATLGVQFTDIVVSPEQTVGIRASFVELGADRKKNRKKVVAGAVVGAILGHILGGDGSKSVIIGAAAGAAAGGAAVASARDRDAEIPAGQILTLQLDEVVTVEVRYGQLAPG